MPASVQVRGGVPRVRVYALTTAVSEVHLTGLTNYLEVRNEGAAIARVYFVEADATAGNNRFVPVAATSGVWSMPAEASHLWLRADSGTTSVRVISYTTK